MTVKKRTKVVLIAGGNPFVFEYEGTATEAWRRFHKSILKSRGPLPKLQKPTPRSGGQNAE